jgi:hypothetical protein
LSAARLAGLSSPEYPGEQPVACRKPQLAALRTHKRVELPTATEKNLQQIKERVAAGKLKGADATGLRVEPGPMRRHSTSSRRPTRRNATRSI